MESPKIEIVLPKELYMLIFILGDDVETAKSLRSVSTLLLSISYDYFKILLREEVVLYHNSGQYSIQENLNNPAKLALGWTAISTKPISFKITIKSLLNSGKNNGATFEPFHYG